LAEISKSLVNEINADLSEEDEDFFYTLDVEGFEDSDKIKKLQNRLTGVTNCVVSCFVFAHSLS
jgi:hypothetical protein